MQHRLGLAGRLTNVTQNGATTASYSYDANGNCTNATRSAQQEISTYDVQDRLVHRQSSIVNADYAYTANGDLATRTLNGQATQYAYDEVGNLTLDGA